MRKNGGLRSRCPAIGSPMMPSPMNPRFAMVRNSPNWKKGPVEMIGEMISNKVDHTIRSASIIPQGRGRTNPQVDPPHF